MRGRGDLERALGWPEGRPGETLREHWDGRRPVDAPRVHRDRPPGVGCGQREGWEDSEKLNGETGNNSRCCFGKRKFLETKGSKEVIAVRIKDVVKMER